MADAQVIKTDGLAAFNIVKKIRHEHNPTVVYPKKGEPDYDVHKWVNILVSNAKAFILGTYHGVTGKHLQKYLDEYCYRFDRLLRTCSNAAPVTYAESRG